MDDYENGDDLNLFAPDDCDEQLPEVDSSSDDPTTLKTGLVSPTAKQYEAFIEKIRKMLDEGNGETLFEVGVGDGGDAGLSEEDMMAAVATLQSVAEQLGCDMNKLRDREVETGKTAEFLLRHKAIEEDFSEVRVAVVGNVDAGKSTLLGVLTHGALDDGRGTARLKLFRHKHEGDTGRTSSVGNDILGSTVKVASSTNPTLNCCSRLDTNLQGSC